MGKVIKLDRREFLRLSALSGGGLVLGAYLPGCGGGDSAAVDAAVDAAVSEPDAAPAPDAAPPPLAVMEPSIFLSIDSTGVVTVFVSRTEMGQGIRTALAMVVAEELDADWASVRATGVVASSAYGSMSTGGSMSVRFLWSTLRSVGATARAMLVSAAAQIWEVEAATCTTEAGEVVHAASSRRLAYAELVGVAKDLPVPTGVPVKDPAEFTLVGTTHARLDSPGKVDGSALYAMDVRVDGMRFAVVARPPVVGGSVTSFVAAPALAVAGVEQVVEVDSGVAVVATSTWAAMQGRAALEVSFASGPNAALDDAALQAILDAKAGETPAQARLDGDPTTALGAASVRLDHVYEVPFLAHAPMEPLNCLADARADSCEVWVPSQDPIGARAAVASALGLGLSAVHVHTTLAGGRFGSGYRVDFVVEAAQVSKAVGAPVQVMWTRDDDMRLSYHRPFSRHLVSGGIDASNDLSALSHVVVAPSIAAQLNGSTAALDWSAVASLYDTPYSIANLYVGYVKANTPVPICWWRSVYLSQIPFANECFLDELAAAAGRNPLEFRTSMLAGAPRLGAVLTRAATEAGWGGALPPGEGRGLACLSAYDSHIGMVAHVAVDGSGKVSVKQVVCAVDCGRVINPDTVKAQMDSGVAFGLSAALHGKISFAAGQVTEGNFHQYRMVEYNEMPAVDVHLIDSTAAVGGIGELGVPLVAPAVANAIFAATGTRVRRLPIGQVAV